MTWKCPDDWKHMPETLDATDGTLMALLFAGAKRFRQVRAPWFRRCNASGKWIWPLQKGWTGVVAIKHADSLAYGHVSGKGSYKIVWLNADQYLIQKLKGNI